jgi:hypothetical protein
MLVSKKCWCAVCVCIVSPSELGGGGVSEDHKALLLNFEFRTVRSADISPPQYLDSDTTHTHTYICVYIYITTETSSAVPWLRRFSAWLSRQSLELDPSPFCVVFVEEKTELVRIFIKEFRISLLCIFPPLLHIKISFIHHWCTVILATGSCFVRLFAWPFLLYPELLHHECVLGKDTCGQTFVIRKRNYFLQPLIWNWWAAFHTSWN